ncbi:uncharacterized protein Tco025E_06773 [Trypanosoma conorhini]|uniref:Uncharacterized protein n=1 Tax=Trypanosoma conorhini TaxID=83891 RepID=A0A422NYS7_9TRYP|nr:uncharacterized protein Tco025E_06773 [Trypanosoma conorhini]RNF10594.1 hypothetical protein Tco025E_06773 [Trypanosoma conorhini]
MASFFPSFFGWCYRGIAIVPLGWLRGPFLELRGKRDTRGTRRRLFATASAQGWLRDRPSACLRVAQLSFAGWRACGVACVGQMSWGGSRRACHVPWLCSALHCSVAALPVGWPERDGVAGVVSAGPVSLGVAHLATTHALRRRRTRRPRWDAASVGAPS